MATTPRLPTAPLVLIPQHFGSLVYDRRTYQYMPFDSAGTMLLRSLAGAPLERTLMGCATTAEREAALSFHDRYSELGFFTLDGRFAAAVLDVQPPADHLTGPLAVHLELTARCNLTCRHCFASASPTSGRDGELTLDELDGLFAQMAAMGSFRLGLTGGEPLLRTDLLDVLALAEAHGLSPCLTTNGLLITERLAEALGRVRLAWLNVSLDGATPDTHDAIRGRGTFARVVEATRILRRHTTFSLAFTVTQYNLHEVQECAHLARELGAQAAVFRPLYPAGRGRTDAALAITFSQYQQALEQLACLESADSAIWCNTHPWGPPSRALNQSVIWSNFGCGAGNSVCSISASGGVSPCSFLGTQMNAGNVRNQPLASVWHDSIVFQRIRALEGNERCRKCPSYGQCGGGCRARALAWGTPTDWNGRDPWCMADTES